MALDLYNLTVEWELICEIDGMACLYLVTKADSKVVSEGLAFIKLD